MNNQTFKVGIEDAHVYGGSAVLDVHEMAAARGLDLERFANLLIKRKTVSMHYEDPVSFGVNAAKGVVDRLAPEEKNRIELVIVASESGIDFGKSMSTYMHAMLGLPRSVRSFEIKEACYGGTAALQMAASFLLSQVSPGAKALVICSDVARPRPNTYAEPTQGAASVALLIGDDPAVLQLDVGANGYWSYEVMDTWRPTPDVETGDPDLSLLSYLDCAENAFLEYVRRAGPTDFAAGFDFLAFHTPFGGLVKGVHRTMMRKFKKAPPAEIEADFKRRVEPSLRFCQEVGNIYSGTVFLALLGLIESAALDAPRRIGIFSYGSGCSSEFYSGRVDERSQARVRQRQIAPRLASRHPLTMAEYEELLRLNHELLVEIEHKTPDRGRLGHIWERQFQGQGLCYLKNISNYHREYAWS
jgi:polyketide biosynthesis 3-hydroxy-3-methylglutaryl-CoA synthase-like enzyme PksG